MWAWLIGWRRLRRPAHIPASSGFETAGTAPSPDHTSAATAAAGSHRLIWFLMRGLYARAGRASTRAGSIPLALRRASDPDRRRRDLGRRRAAGIRAARAFEPADRADGHVVIAED